MKGKIQTQDLYRLCYNALHYANKSRSCRGYTLWIRGADRLRVVTTNDYFILTDSVIGLDYVPSAQEMDRVMPLDFLKMLTAELRGADGEVELSDLQFTIDKQAAELLWQADEFVFNESLDQKQEVHAFALNPQDLQKLSLLEPKKEYPIDFRAARGRDGDMKEVTELYFRYGPNCRGAISTLFRPDLLEEYSGEEMWR